MTKMNGKYYKKRLQNGKIILQEAKKRAKEAYPIPPQLDSLPDFSVSTSPTEKIF